MSKEFLTPKKIITGIGAIEDSIKYLVTMGKKTLIVTGRIVSELDAFKMLVSKLSENGLDCVVFKDITGEPTDVMIEEGLKVYRENNCDFLIGMGGGSPLDAIKAIAALNVCGGKLSDYMGKEISTEEITQKVHEAWKTLGKNVDEIKTLNVYLKPEEAAAYYVIYEETTGKVAI